MPYRSCPNCYAPAPRLAASSHHDPAAWHLRCHECGETWTVPKEDREPETNGSARALKSLRSSA